MKQISLLVFWSDEKRREICLRISTRCYFVHAEVKIFMKDPNVFPEEAWAGILSEESRTPSVLCDIKISLFINAAWIAGFAKERERGAPKCEIDASARKDCGAEESPGLNRGTVSALPVAPIHNHMKRELRSRGPFISIQACFFFNNNSLQQKQIHLYNNPPVIKLSSCLRTIWSK